MNAASSARTLVARQPSRAIHFTLALATTLAPCTRACTWGMLKDAATASRWDDRSANSTDFSRLEFNTNPFLEKQLQLVIDGIDDLQQESSKLYAYERAVQRQHVAQAAYLAKKRAETNARRARGEDPSTAEDPSSIPTFKSIAKPSRLDAVLITNQMAAYLQLVNQFSGQSMTKLFLIQSLNASQ